MESVPPAMATESKSAGLLLLKRLKVRESPLVAMSTSRKTTPRLKDGRVPSSRALRSGMGEPITGLSFTGVKVTV